ncbi:MAG: hypothetical protein U0X39_01465 [Bacteroidales bacterium]
MKKLILTSILIGLVTAGTTIKAQDREEYLGMPGDNLNLYAVMKLFQESKTLEEFEKNLNDENLIVNNLDLNGDNLVDYIRVNDNIENDVHYIVLQVAINERETQDIGVFTVQKMRNGEVQIQLIGDEDLYGKNYIVEPIYNEGGETPNPGYVGNRGRNVVTVTHYTTYDISLWPIIRYMYLPDYVVWHSRWYWGFYPDYWRPWRPYYWHYYYGYHYHYNDYYFGHYRVWHTYRTPMWRDYYYVNRRVYSPVVRDRIHNEAYKVTYSHPEQRREGEARYTATRRDNVTSTSVNRRSDNSQNRQVDRVNTRSTTSTNRRSEGNVNTNVSRENRSNSTSVNRERREAPVSRSSSTRVNSSAPTRNTESRVNSSQRNESPSVSRTSQSRSSESRASNTSSQRASSSRSSISSSSNRSSGKSISAPSSRKSSSSSSRSSSGSSKSGSGEKRKSESKSSSGRR